MFLLLKSGTPYPGGMDQRGVSPYYEIAALIVLVLVATTYTANITKLFLPS